MIFIGRPSGLGGLTEDVSMKEDDKLLAESLNISSASIWACQSTTRNSGCRDL